MNTEIQRSVAQVEYTVGLRSIDRDLARVLAIGRPSRSNSGGKTDCVREVRRKPVLAPHFPTSACILQYRTLIVPITERGAP